MNSMDRQKFLDEIAELRATTKSLEERVDKLEKKRRDDSLGVTNRDW